MSNLYILNPELKMSFLMKLELDGILDRVGMKSYLGLSRITDVDKILEELQTEELVESGEGEDEGEIILSEKGFKYLNPEDEDEGDSADVIVEADKLLTGEEIEEVTTQEDFFAVMDFVSNAKGIPMTPLDHQLMRERLNMSATKLEEIIKGLTGGGYLAVESEKLIIGEGIERVHGGNWPIEFASPETEDGEVGPEPEAEEESGVEVVAEVVVDEEVASSEDVADTIEVDSSEVNVIRSDLQQVLQYVEDNSGSIRNTDSSFAIMQHRIGIDNDVQEQALKELQRLDCLESTGGRLVLTATGRRYLSGELIFNEREDVGEEDINERQ